MFENVKIENINGDLQNECQIWKHKKLKPQTPSSGKSKKAYDDFLITFRKNPNKWMYRYDAQDTVKSTIGNRNTIVLANILKTRHNQH